MNELTTIEKLEKVEQDALERVKAWVIQTQDDYRALDAYLVEKLAMKKIIIADFRASKEATHAAHQSVCNQEAVHLGVVDDIRSVGKQKLYAWDKAQEKARQEAEDKARAEAQEKADLDALDAAEAAQRAGRHEDAEAIIREAAQAPAPTVILPSTTPKRSTVIRTVNKFRFKDIKAVKPDFLMPDEKKIGGVVRAMRGATNIPGVRAFARRVTSTKAHA